MCVSFLLLELIFFYKKTEATGFLLDVFFGYVIAKFIVWHT